MIKVLETISGAGTSKNEDLIWQDENLLMLLDGSSGLVPMALDAQWYTRCLADGLKRSAEGALCERVNYALHYARECFFKEAPDYNSRDFPSAAGVFVQERAGFIEVLALGDCTACLILENGQEEIFTDNAIRRLDGEVFELMKQLRESSGMTFPELMKTDAIKQRLLENRHKMNCPDGYKILSIEMEPCKESDVAQVPANQVRRIVLFSDGFDELADQLKCPGASLKDLYAELRSRETADPNLEITPRFKLSDDASALIAEVI